MVDTDRQSNRRHGARTGPRPRLPREALEINTFEHRVLPAALLLGLFALFVIQLLLRS